MVSRNCAQAHHLAERVAADPRLERVGPAPLNIVCLRFLGPGLPPEAEDALNADIVADLQEQGIAAPSTTRLGGRLVIRVSITNHRTQTSDLDLLLEALVACGESRLTALGAAE